MYRLASAVLFASLVLASPAAADDVSELRSAFEKAVASLNSGDIDGFLKSVHEDALSFYSCGPTSGKEGKEACQLDWERFFGKSREAKFEPANMQYRVIGDTGIAWGEYHIKVANKDGKSYEQDGRYTMTYAKVDGKWKVVMQHNTPAEMGPAPARPRKRAEPSGS